MEMRRLIRTELEVSRLCLGTMTFGGQVEEGDAGAMVDLAVDSGINFIDTANNYTGGRSEHIVGRCLKGRRDGVVLASKVFNRVGDAIDQKGLSTQAILRCVEESLSRLQTDYLDICYFHAPDYEVPLEESLSAMDQLVKAGKVRYVGVSNYASWQLTKLHWIAEREKLPTVRVSQPMYNLIARGIEQEFVPACRDLEVAMVAYNPLAGGLLTGKQRPGAPLPGTRFAMNEQYVDRYWKNGNFEAVSALDQCAQFFGCSMVGLALRWLLHHSATDVISLGASSMDQLRENLSETRGGELSDAAVEACDVAWRKLRGVTPKYNR